MLASSYCVSYGELDSRWKYASCKGVKPYEDWVVKGRADRAWFIFSKHCLDDIIRLVFVPDEKLIFIDIDIDNYTCEIAMNVIIDENNKKVIMNGVFCNSVNHAPNRLGTSAPPSMQGGLKAFRQNIRYLWRVDIIGYLISEFFGDEWEFVEKGERSTIILGNCQLERGRSIRNYMQCDSGPWNRTIGLFDRIYHDSATKIQAAWKGWVARKTYRFNPHTRLGRHLVMQEFYELTSS